MTRAPATTTRSPRSAAPPPSSTLRSSPPSPARSRPSSADANPRTGLAEKTDHEEAAARAAAATSSQALAERRARHDKALRAGAVPLRPARPPMTLSGAA